MRADGQKAEMTAKFNFQMMEQTLKTAIAQANKDLEETKKAKAAAEEGKANAEGDLSMTNKNLADAQKAEEKAVEDFAALKAAKEDEIATPVKRKIPLRRQEKKADEAHVPIYIHKNVNYQRRGDASIDEKLKKTFELVESHFFIPEDFERNRSFGPLSGTCFEERAIRAYNLSLLEPKNDADAALEICSHCAVLGHRRSDCPDLI